MGDDYLRDTVLINILAELSFVAISNMWTLSKRMVGFLINKL